MTKKGTVSFKGQQRTSLLKFGSLFTFSEFKDKSGTVVDNVFILTPVEDDKTTVEAPDFTEEEESVQELNNGTVEKEMAEMLGEENYEDALPF
jgi:hypothetical protein